MSLGLGYKEEILKANESGMTRTCYLSGKAWQCCSQRNASHEGCKQKYGFILGTLEVCLSSPVDGTYKGKPWSQETGGTACIPI